MAGIESIKNSRDLGGHTSKMSSRNYKNYSADGLIVVFENNLTDTNVLKEIVHEIPFRIKAFNKLAPYLKKAEAIIAANSQVSTSGLKQDNESDVFITSQSEALVEKARNKPVVKDSRSQITNIKLKDLKLRSLEYSLLKAEGVEDLKDLVQKTEKDLLKIPNFRKSSLTKINALLEDYGLTLRMKLDIRGGSNVIQNIPSSVSDINLSLIEQKFLAKAIIANNVKQGISSSELKQDNNSIGLEAVKFQRAIADQLINQSVENSRPKSKNIMLEDLELRVREYRCLKAEGVLDLKGLVQKTEDDLLKIPSFGKTSLSNLNALLEYHGLTLGMNPDVIMDSEAIQNSAPISAHNLTIDELDLSQRERNCFLAKEIQDLQTLVSNTQLDLLRIPNFGKKSLKLVTATLKSFGLSLGMESSSVTWIEPSESAPQVTNDGITIPQEFDESKNFADTIGDFIEQYSDTLTHKYEQLIFDKRIACKKENIPTLEDLGQEVGVTRERIRQVERKLIRTLVKAIFGSHFVRGIGQVDRKFSGKWKTVAAHFDGFDEISYFDFTTLLLTTWNISEEDLKTYFNFVSVVFTGKVKSHLVSVNKRALSLAPLREKFKATNDTNDTKISELRLGKSTKYFGDRGIFTIGEFLNTGANLSDSQHRKKLLQALDVAALNTEGNIDWDRFIECNKLEIIGRPQYGTAQVFLEELPEIILEMIDRLNLWTHSKEIFIFRTSKHHEQRPTLMEAAKVILGKSTFGPVISRIQTHFLDKIRIVVLDKNYSEANFWLADGVINYFEKSNQLYELASGDFDKFVYLIRLRWGISDLNLNNISVLWTVIDGYTPNRYFHLTSDQVRKRKAQVKPLTTSGKIKLAGFRDVY